MIRTRVKFCGLTRPGDVRLACELGADAVGFVLAEGSPRRVAPGQLGGLRAAVPPLVHVVALFQDGAGSDVLDAIQRLRPTLLQFHGREDDSFCRSFGLPFVKTLPMAGGSDEAIAMARLYPSAVAFLLDGHGVGEQGGRGVAFDWSAAPRLARPIFLAGGLAPDNVGRAIATVRPYVVDVSSGIESAPGQKDGDKMQQFLDEVRRADQQ
ncbi:phosphoribosylanthranilate isomerase [soil metagenome]